MNKWTDVKEKIVVNGVKYQLHLKHATGDPVVGELKLGTAIDKLSDGLRNLPHLAKLMEMPHAVRSPLRADAPPQWFLVLDHNDELEGEKLRMNLSGSPMTAQPLMASQPLSEIVEAMELDKMTVADDPEFLDALKTQQNLPKYLKDGLEKMYR